MLFMHAMGLAYILAHFVLNLSFIFWNKGAGGEGLNTGIGQQLNVYKVLDFALNFRLDDVVQFELNR